MSNKQKTTLSENQQLQPGSATTPESYFVFRGPASLPIKSPVKGEENYCSLDQDQWSWRYGGILTTINWAKLNLNKQLRELLKAFIFHRLRLLSPKTVVTSDVRLISFFKDSRFHSSFPWNSKETIAELLAEVRKSSEAFYGLKAFYKFGVSQGFAGFTKEFNNIIQETEIERRSSGQYQKVLMQEINRLTPSEESQLLDYLYQPVSTENYCQYRDNVLLHLAFELAPRPIQLYALSADDIEVVRSASQTEHYFSLWLPTAKKKNAFNVEKRYRKITARLGEKIVVLLDENKRLYGEGPLIPLFIDPDAAERKDGTYGRLSTRSISDIISNILQSRGFKSGNATFLRHHLAQSLADQGASAETIAEILGHNSTLPARAYIAATPAIAIIKTRALGKNRTYLNIMSMLMTGQIIEKEIADMGTWIKGMVGDRYIGGIGACGLPRNTACPKNPVYACYTCKQFHPFRDGTHQEVRQHLQKEVQYFIDIAEKAMDLKHNRAFLQLEQTIEAVDAVIQRIESQQPLPSDHA
jgi:integrase